jgi:hypothetical protein
MQEPEAYHARFLRELDRERDRPRCLRLCHPFAVVLQGGIPRLKFDGVGVIGIRSATRSVSSCSWAWRWAQAHR